MSILCQDDIFFFLLYTTSFFNVLYISYWVATTTCALTSSYHLCRLLLFLDVCCHIISADTTTFVLTSCLTISGIMVPRISSLMTISAYNFSVPFIFSLHFSGICLIYISNRGSLFVSGTFILQITCGTISKLA